MYSCPTVLLRLVWVGWQTSVRILPRALDDLPPHLRQGSAFVGSREPRWHTWRRQCMAEEASVPFGPSVECKSRQGLQPPIEPRSCPCKSSHFGCLIVATVVSSFRRRGPWWFRTRKPERKAGLWCSWTCWALWWVRWRDWLGTWRLQREGFPRLCQARSKWNDALGRG